MREQLVAWAGDCRVLGDVDLGDGRLSDWVNGVDTVTFHDARVTALDDGRELAVDELEVERRDLHLVEVRGHRGDPGRRLRTAQDRVMIQAGPYVVTGSIHRPPISQPLAPLAGWSRFLPVTDAVVAISGHPDGPVQQDVVLVNRERITRSERLATMRAYDSAPWGPLPAVEPDQG